MDYEVIVIGSGAGGLTAALALAQAGKSVLVIEQHDRPGGWTQSFTLQGYSFSPGVHYIGDLQEGGGLRAIYDGLGVSRDLTFCEINPDGYDHIFIGDRRVDFPRGKENLVDRLSSQFPHEATGIKDYFTELVSMVESLSHVGDLNHPVRSAMSVPVLIKWMRAPASDLINSHVTDPILRGVLAGQSGDHGLPPSRVSAFMHAGITYHYLNGGYYPLGGASAIPRAFLRALKSAGGEIMLRTRVKKILLAGRQVMGVELENGDQISARIVVSNADPEVTFGQLIGQDSLSAKLKAKVKSLEYSTSCISLFFATDLDLRSAGLDSGNFWYYAHPDVDEIYTDGLTKAGLRKETPPGIFLTVTTLKDPSKKHGGIHTCESFAFVGYDAFEQWAHTKFGDRPTDYEALKEDLASRMVQGLEKRIPGLSRHITFSSLGTPLTNEHYLNATRGNLYGIAKTASQVGPWAFQPNTEYEGLFLCGASTLSHGVSGATTSGIDAAKTILKCHKRDLLTQKDPGPRFLPSEDITEWPEDLKAKIARGDKVIQEERDEAK